VVRAVAETVFLPLTVGGGIRSLDQIRELLLCGADKVSINSGAVRDPELLSQAAHHFGSQCIVLALDARRTEAGRWEVCIDSGRAGTGIDALSWAEQAVRLGAGEILLTSMDADGTLEGYDLELTRSIAERVGVPLIASGGAGNCEHFVQVLTEGKADAALAASLFHDGRLSIDEVKRFLLDRGIAIRPVEGEEKT